MRLEARFLSTAIFNSSSCVVWNNGNLFSRGPNFLNDVVDDEVDFVEDPEEHFEERESNGSVSLTGETGGE